MAESSNQPQKPPTDKAEPKVYSVSQDKDGSFHFSRRDFVYLGAAVGGTLLIKGVCPRFLTKSTASGPVQAAREPMSGAYIHTGPSIASNIADTLQPDEMVRLVRDHPDLGWVEVATQDGRHGWVQRRSLDFSRAIKSSSPSFDLSAGPAPELTAPSRTHTAQLGSGDHSSQSIPAAGQDYSCGQAIENGDFEAGSVTWVEDPGGIISEDWPDPHQGSWVAWMTGQSVVKRLTQLFHIPADVLDEQKLEFYRKVTSLEVAIQPLDTLVLRFLDAGGSPLDVDLAIADNTDKGPSWQLVTIDLSDVTSVAGQNIQVQFEAAFNAAKETHFVLDSVSMELICAGDAPTDTPTPTHTPQGLYVFLPIVIRVPTPTPTSTPTPSKTPCPSHCASHCAGHCAGDSCSSDYCSSDYCSSDCSSDLCPFDCLHCSCIGHWCSYN